MTILLVLIYIILVFSTYFKVLNAVDLVNTIEIRDMSDFTPLSEFVNSLNDYGLNFLFSPEGKQSHYGAHWHDPDTIYKNLQKSIQFLNHVNDIKDILQDLANLDNVNVGQTIEDIKILQEKDNLSEEVISAVNTILHVALARILQKLVIDRGMSLHPQNLRHILSYFSAQKPELLLIIETLLNIIKDQDHFAIVERSRASKVLVNSYRIETLFIYISQNEALNEDQKEYVFSWLTAFQKVYRKIQETLFDKQKDKKTVAREWFNASLSQLKKDGLILREDYKLPISLKKFINSYLEYRPKELKETGRSILLTINNEDVIRMMHRTILENQKLTNKPEVVKKIYNVIYLIMHDYRKLCTAQRATKQYMENTFSSFSPQIRESQLISSSTYISSKRVPVVGQRNQHTLLEETRKNLEYSGMNHLFEVWPIPETSQNVFNTICKLKDMIPSGQDHMVCHFLYREKLLEFLMRLERMGIKIVKRSDSPLITNAFQLSAMGTLKKGEYFGSTGHWNSPNQKPPCVICCTNPKALGNCYGHMLRHIAFRVFLATGEFYESPFILDSTQRFGQIDEDAQVEALLIRPGLFILDIPDSILACWKQEQHRQMDSRLDKIIQDRINYERINA